MNTIPTASYLNDVNISGRYFKCIEHIYLGILRNILILKTKNRERYLVSIKEDKLALLQKIIEYENEYGFTYFTLFLLKRFNFGIHYPLLLLDPITIIEDNDVFVEIFKELKDVGDILEKTNNLEYNFDIEKYNEIKDMFINILNKIPSSDNMILDDIKIIKFNIIKDAIKIIKYIVYYVNFLNTEEKLNGFFFILCVYYMKKNLKNKK